MIGRPPNRQKLGTGWFPINWASGVNASLTRIPEREFFGLAQRRPWGNSAIEEPPSWVLLTLRTSLAAFFPRGWPNISGISLINDGNGLLFGEVLWVPGEANAGVFAKQ